MKKFLLALACSFLLTGCLATEPKEEQDNNNNQNETPTNNNEQNNTDEPQNNGDSDGKTDGNEQNNDDEEQGGTTLELKTKTISFFNGGFTNSSLDQTQSQQNFINWFNGDDDLLESINYSGYSQLNYIGNEKDSWRFSTLILGSSTKDGDITFNFSKKITAVKLNIQGYCKYIAYSDSYNVDTDSKFYLDDELTDLSISAGFTGELEKKDVSKTYSTPTNSLNIKSEGGRVFVHSMELTYIQE